MAPWRGFSDGTRSSPRRAASASAEQRAAQRACEIVKDVHPAALDDDERRILHEEVARLPEKYRKAVVLCYFEGQTHEHAAETLAWPVGTVRGYLARARGLLRSRLIRRGVAPTVAVSLLAAEKASPAAALTPSLVEAVTIAVTAGSTTSTILALAASVSRRLAIVRTGLAAILLAVVGMASGGGGLVVTLRGASPYREASYASSAQRVTDARRDAPKRLDLDGEPLPDGAVARLGTIRFNHGSAIQSIVYTPDGKSILSFGNDHILRHWDALTGRERAASAAHENRTWAYSLSSDGKRLTTFWGGEFVRRSDFATGVELSRWVAPSRNASYDLRSMVVSPDGATVAAPSLSAKSVCTLWNLARTGDGRRLETDERRLASVAFSPGGDLIATAGAATIGSGGDLKNSRGVPIGSKPEAGSVRIWNVRDGTMRQLYLVDGCEPNSVLFSPDSRTLASCFTDGTIRVFDLVAGKRQAYLNVRDQAQTCLAFSPDGRTLASRSKSSSNTLFDLAPVHIWDLTTFKETRQFPANEQFVSAVVFAPDGKTLASAGSDNVVMLWDVATGSRINPSHTDRSSFTCVIASPADGRLITAGHDGTIRRWDAATGRERKALGSLPRGVVNMALCADGRYLLIVGTDGVIQLRDAISGNELRRFVVDRSTSGCLAGLAFSLDGRLACAGGKIWDVRSGRALAVLCDTTQGRNFQPWAAYSVAFTPDGKRVIATDQQTVTLFDVVTGRDVRQDFGK